MEIEWRDIKKLIPYAQNTKKHDAKQVANIANSIKRFGWRQPIVVDKNGVVVIGHGRLLAAKKLGNKKVPVTVADDLSEDDLRELRIADNKTNESEWDEENLNLELPDLDFEGFDFDFSIDYPDAEEDDDGYYGDERERTNKAYNLDLVGGTALTNDFWQMPIIRNNNHIPNDLIGFNYAKTSDNKAAGIHFYVDDYQFERLWNAPDKYVDLLSEYDCILSPDFSLYMDMPMAMKIWNVYRSRQIGAYYQNAGLAVIPTISWAEPETFEFCFKGIPKGSIVSISTIGVKQDKTATRVWRDGVDEMIKQIEPSAILIYGGKLEYDFGKIQTKYFENKVTQNWKNDIDG